MIKEFNYGMLYDCVSLYVIYFNREYILKTYELYNTNAEVGLKPYNEIIEKIPEIPEVLRIFFNVSYTKPSIFSEYVFVNAVKSECYSISEVENNLFDSDGLYKFLLNHCFGNKLDKENSDFSDAYIEINKKNIDDNLKFNLLYYFQNKEEVAKLLKSSFIDIFKYIKEFHMQNEETINQIIIKSKVKKIGKYISGITNMFKDDNYNTYICLLNNHVFLHGTTSKEKFVIIGSQLSNYIDNQNIGRAVSLNVFGKAFSDQIRIEIIELLITKKELCISDMMSEMDMPRTSIAYHIDLLTNNQIINYRKKKNLKYYSLNELYFQKMIKTLHEYISKIKK